MTSLHPLDDPVFSSLTGAHAHLAIRHGRVLFYPADVSPFFVLPNPPSPDDWAAVADTVGPGGIVPLAGVEVPPPPGWTIVMTGEGVQLVDDGVAATPDPGALTLGPHDVPDMLALVERTRPGPFLPRTIELGTYLGFRRDGELIAMAGERMHPPGWTEISAVCTEPAFRGQGLATKLVLAVAAGIRARGERPFMHASAGNPAAIRLYESLGFRIRRRLTFDAAQVPLR
jgi:ribosomal protein S18 acetylase RimI-like enzyme